MIKIYRTKDRQGDFMGYILTCGKHSIAAESLDKLVIVMKSIGIDDAEIEYGLVELEINDHDMAEYGVKRKFLYSKKVA